MMVLVPGLVAKFPMVYNTKGIGFHFLGFSTVSSRLHYGMVRNYGIFREPGMFCVMLTVALINEILVLKQFRGKYILVYTAAMVTTFSTAGYIILAALYLYYLIVEKNAKHRGRYIVLILAALVVLGTQTDLLSMEGAIFDKFTRGSNSYGSWLARLRSLTQSIVIAVQNPVFGVGRYALYDAILGSTGVYQAVDNTNTILIGFAAYGIPFGVILSWGCWAFVRKYSSNLFTALCLFVILLLALANEDMGQNILFYYLVFDGLCRNRKEREASAQLQSAAAVPERI
jgi:hypothetical protein